MDPIQKRKPGLKPKPSLDPINLDAETAREAARLLVLARKLQLQEIGNNLDDGEQEMDKDPSYMDIDSSILSLVGANPGEELRLRESGGGIAGQVGGKEIPVTMLSQMAEQYGIDPQVFVDILKEEMAAPTDAREFTDQLKKRRDEKLAAQQQEATPEKDWGKGLSDKKVSLGIFSRFFGG